MHQEKPVPGGERGVFFEVFFESIAISTKASESAVRKDFEQDIVSEHVDRQWTYVTPSQYSSLSPWRPLAAYLEPVTSLVSCKELEQSCEQSPASGYYKDQMKCRREMHLAVEVHYSRICGEY